MNQTFAKNTEFSKKPTESTMTLRVWGARGSISVPGSLSMKYGGNTSCLEVHCGQQTLIFDGGTGMRALGNKLVDLYPLELPVFFTHMHWDHIQGFPFFKPVYKKGNKFKIYGSKKLQIQETLTKQMAAPTFPIRLDQLEAELSFIDLEDEGEIRFPNPDSPTISYIQLPHPNNCTGYRINYKDRSIVYATDTEHSTEPNKALIDFAQGADVLIYDAQYTPEEYEGIGGISRKGWGHSTWEEGVKISSRANIKKLLLWHHDPDHSDILIQKIERSAQAVFHNTQAAYEGMHINIMDIEH